MINIQLSLLSISHYGCFYIVTYLSISIISILYYYIYIYCIYIYIYSVYYITYSVYYIHVHMHNWMIQICWSFHCRSRKNDPGTCSLALRRPSSRPAYDPPTTAPLGRVAIKGWWKSRGELWKLWFMVDISINNGGYKLINQLLMGLN